MWEYNGIIISKLEDFPEGCIGFVYKITNTETNKIYIGKKLLNKKKTKKLGKKAIATQVGRGRKKTKAFVLNWLNRLDKPLAPEKSEWDLAKERQKEEDAAYDEMIKQRQQEREAARALAKQQSESEVKSGI